MNPAPLRRNRGPLIREIIGEYIRVGMDGLSVKRLKDNLRLFQLFNETFGAWRVDDLKPLHVVEWIKSKTTWNSGHTRRNAVHTLSVAFNFAIRNELTTRNPLKYVTMEASEQRRPMTDDEFVKLLRVAPAYFKRILMFLRLTGCRPGELRALRYSHIDWERGLAILPQHKTRKKTGKPRVIVLVPTLLKMLRFMERRRASVQYYAALKRVKLTAPDGSEDDYVFLNNRGTRWETPSVACHFVRIRKAAGLPRDCLLYGLRHNFATQAVARGLNLAVVSTLLGHHCVSTTARQYVHLMGEVDTLRDAAQQAMQPKAKPGDNGKPKRD